MSVVLEAALTLVMVLTPTAMYIALWRGLMRLRDDDLVNRIDTQLANQTRPSGPERPAVVGTPALEPDDIDPELDAAIADRVKEEDGLAVMPGWERPEGEADAESGAGTGGETEPSGADDDALISDAQLEAARQPVAICEFCGTVNGGGDEACHACGRDL